MGAAEPILHLLFWPLWAATLLGLGGLGCLVWVLRPLGQLPASAPWPERARRLWPGVRVHRQLSGMFLPTLFMAGAFAGPFNAHTHGWPWEASVALTALLLGALLQLQRLALERAAGWRRRGLVERLRQGIAQALLWSPWRVLLLIGGVASAREHGWIAALLTLGLTAGVIWGGGLKIAQLLGIAIPGPERLVAAQQRAAARAGLPAPLHSPVVLRLEPANAFAFTLLGRLGITQRALDALSEEELDAVLVHELAHLAEPRWARLMRAGLGGGYAILALALWLAMTGSGVLGLALFFGVALLTFQAPKQLLRLERRADEAARGGLRVALATALERLSALNLTPAVTGQPSSTHPDLIQRLAEAGVSLPWPRPEPPASSAARLVPRLLVGALLGGMFLCDALGWLLLPR